MSKDMTTYGQYLEARELSDVLLKKYAQEITQGRRPMYDAEDVDEAFRDVAAALGYRVERIEAPALAEAAE